jgi:glycosyltransferase involved in cell wall biosynthesis
MPRMTSGVRWMSIGPGSGYGYASEAYLSGLRAAGMPISWTPLGWASDVWDAPFGPVAHADLDGAVHGDIAYSEIGHDTVVAHSVPVWHDQLAAETSGKLLVAFTTWETDRLHHNWVPILNRYDRVLVPSQFNAAVFKSSGVTVPITVVPHIARSVQTSACDGRQGEDNRFVFYLIATWTTRKAILDAVEAFLAAFTSAHDVVLVIHTTPVDYVAHARPTQADRPRSDATWFTLAKALGGHSNVPDMVLSTRSLSQAEMDELHTRCDCFISLSRGEGWGLGAFDAAAHGKPVIVTGWSAAREFLPADYPYFVEYDLIPTVDDEPDEWWQPRDGERWAKARIPHATALLRHVFEHREEARSWGQASQSHIHDNFNSTTITRRLLEAIGTD